jgi:hypothetical protein
MGLIAKIIDSFTGKDNEPAAKAELHKNDNADSRIFLPPGVDSKPLNNDICFTEDSEDTEGGKDILGFNDPKNPPVSEKGEYRAYSRDSSGNIKAFHHLKKDGEIEIDSDSGKINIKITPDGKITVVTQGGAGDLIVDNVSSKNHIHIDSWGRPTSEPLEIGEPVPAPPTIVTLESNINTNSKEFDGVIYDQHGHPYSWTDPAGSGVTGGPE